jgi:ribosomal protein S18 acetylase RimI-like enzyme
MSEAVVEIATRVTELDADLDDPAAELLARCPALGSAERAAAVIEAARADDASSLFGLIVDGRLSGAYILRKVTMSNEIAFLAVDPALERRGFGKMCLYDALFRSGKRPLVVEADDSNLAFFKRCGFKLVGKRKAADGSPRYRLGWHAPIPKPGEPGTVIC